MKKIAAIIIMAIVLGTAAYAAPVTSANVPADGRNICITGQISEVSEPQQVTLFVGEPDNIIYIGQVTSSASGEFSFNFLLPPNLPGGVYTYHIGNGAGATKITGTFEYPGDISTRKFLDAELNISVNSYTPKIEGKIYCMTDKNINVSITSTTDSTVIVNDVLQPVNGECDISYTLPSLLNPKAYTVAVSCMDTSERARIELSVDSSVVLVSANGTVTTADGVTVEAIIKNVSDGTVVADTRVSGTKSVDGTIPNLISNMSYDLDVKAYENYYPAIESTSCALTGEVNGIVTAYASARNMTSLENREFEITYDSTKLEAVSLWGMYSENEVGTGVRDDIEIVSYTPGRIVFKVRNKEIPEGRVWSGMLNMFKFKILTADFPTVTIR